MAAAANRRDLFLNIGGSVSGLEAAAKAGRSVLNEFGASANATADQVQAAFRKMATEDPARQARAMETAYSQSFAKIRDNARSVLNAPTGEAAMQILDANATRGAAEAAEAQAKGLRLVADAAARAAAGTTDNTAAARVYATAAEANAIGAEKHAASLRTQAAVLDSVESELRQVASAQGMQLEATGRGAGINRQHAASMQNLGFQFQDFAVQVVSGQSAVVAFAQQLPQATGALVGMEGKAGAVGAFFSGPWGIALSVGLVALTPLVSKLLESNDALDDSVKKLKKDAEETEITRQARERFSRTVEGQIDAQRRLNEELDRANRTPQQTETANLDQSRRTMALQQRETLRLKGEVDKARRNLDEAKGEALSRISGGDPMVAAQFVEQLRKQFTEAVDRYNASLAKTIETQQGVRNAEITIADRQVVAELDAVAAATERYTVALGRLREQRERGEISAQRYRAQARGLREQQDAEIATARKAEQQSRQSGTFTDFGSPIAGRGSITGRYGEARPGHTHAGIDIAAPHGTPVSATAAGVVKFAGKRGAYGNVVYVDHGGGTQTRYAHLSRIGVKEGDRVGQGDQLGAVGSTGRSTGNHLHYEVRQGNRAVDPRLGRYRTDAGSVEDQATRSAETAARKREAAERKAEAARQKALSDADAYAELLNRAQAEQLQLTRSRTVDIATGSQLDRTAVELSRDRLIAEAKLGVDKGRWTQAQADALVLLYRQNAAAEMLEIRQREGIALADQQLAAEDSRLRREATILQLQADGATTAAERRSIALRLLAIEEEELRNRARRLIASDNPADWAAGEAMMQQVDAEHPYREAAIERQTAGPMDRYRDQLVGNIGDMDDALANVKVRGLQAVEDGLVGVIDGTADAATAFKRMAASILADLARIAVQKLILSVVTGGGFSEGGKIEGFATGGRITGPGTGTSDSILALVGGRKPIMVSNGEAIVNAAATARYWPIIDAMNKGTLDRFATGGLVDPSRIRLRPLPSPQSVARNHSGGRVYFDLRGALTTADVLAQMNAMAAQHAQVSIIAGSQMAQADIEEDRMQWIPQ